jgi:DNA-directed RNA polymerase subunit RPC12/RpoP
MGQVVKLADRKTRRVASRGGAPRLLGEQTYFCMGCDTDRFLLYPGGRVQCAHCGSLMENLRVTDEAAPERSRDA